MNLFPEEPRKTKEDIYYKDIEGKELELWSEYVNIRIEVRNLISGMQGVELQLAKELLKKGKPDYKKTKDLFRRFTAAINPCPCPKK